MNLIEQLGGYEKAKAFLNAASYTIDELIMMQRSGLRTQHVEKALLQYRREHGIYEVGDKVVFKGNWTANNNVLTIDGNERSIRMDTVLGLINHFRHVTDEEIEAGKRLEVGDAN